MVKISNYIISDLLKSRVLVGYLLLMSAIGWGTFLMESQSEKALLILMQVTLFILPMICMIFSTVYYYNSMEFIRLILAQPISRDKVISGFYTGLSSALLLCFLLGVSIPLLLFYPTVESAYLILGGCLLTLVFTAIALFIGTFINDKAKGMGVSILVWVIFGVLYDALLLFLMFQFSDYPIEKFTLILSFLNPIDIARILIIIKTESAAMLGLSGSLFRNFFGSSLGLCASILVLAGWCGLPFLFTLRKFLRKDF
jgi:Cu-processing system permease protein